ncbi:hypothetical protein [Sediminibacterium sp.]|uniref:hypothetical protein n=1 Tax=Sediminibacterium sp. TaxID=1917865 RepID=UPI0025D955C6|nr:hypothetical protein [Sediminibacterium sp.]
MKNWIINSLKLFYLFAIPFYSILFLYNLNSSEVHLSQTVFPLIISFVIVFIILKISQRLINGSEAASLISFYVIFVFFNFGFLYDFCIKLRIPIIQQGRWLFLFLFIILILSVLIIKRATKNQLSISIAFFRVSYFSLIIFVSFSIANKEFVNKNANNIKSGYEISTLNEFKGNVYYIILDGYASSNVSRKLHGFDNKAFFDSLKNLGFYFPEKSKSNYSMTFLSLSSSMNMDYLNNLVPQLINTEGNSTMELQNLIQYPKIFKKFKSKGYKIYNISSGWGPTSFINSANVNSSSLFLSPFYYQWAQFTLIRPLIQRRLYESRGENILHSFSELKNIKEKKGKLFIFSHIISPHRPYIFDKNGDIVNYEDDDFSSLNSHINKYYSQVQYLNKQIIEVLKEILKNSKIKPIIILQSDHGSDLYFNNSFIKLALKEPLRSNQISERTENLNAIYLPYNTSNSIKLINNLTPVNTFRLIFNEYFKDSLQYRDNEIFYSDYYHQYRFNKIKY